MDAEINVPYLFPLFVLLNFLPIDLNDGNDKSVIRFRFQPANRMHIVLA